MFKKAFFSNSNIYGKIMFTIDDENVFRIHLMKDLDEEIDVFRDNNLLF